MAPHTLIDADQFVAADWARARDDPSVDADEVLSGLGNEQRHKMADAERRLLGLETPEYEGWNAAQVHEESGDILDALLDYCRSLRLNVVVDATMKTLDGALTRVETFKAAGYRVEGHYMHLPRQVAARRAVDRFCTAERGRYVPVAVILANVRNEANFDVLRPYLDAWSFWDNHVDIGESPRPISGLRRPSLRPP